MSATSAVARTGFQRLVTKIGLDPVGLVLGIEMARLARSGRAWYQLIELCALSGAVLADLDGVYDPADYNDRLVLGRKGPLPSGYVRRPSEEVVFDPDEQVQTVIRLIFTQFERAGPGCRTCTSSRLRLSGIQAGCRGRRCAASAPHRPPGGSGRGRHELADRRDPGRSYVT
jgi:DNA invertase Pin-like site-specific DNA recombinase